MQIRSEEQHDIAAVRVVNSSAFDTPVEARLVDALRAQVSPIISLVAEIDGGVVGHILCSPVVLEGHPQLKIAGLAPLAVLPNHQRKGIGSALVEAGLDRCRETGYGAVVVLGHSEYYSRFGFAPASQCGIRCEYDVPDDAFMIAELCPGYLQGATGMIQFHHAFKEL